MKLTICLVLLSVASYSYAQSHSITWGIKNPGDRQLFRDIREKKGSFMSVKEEDLAINVQGKINYINALDQYVDDNGGKAMLTDGGVGYNTATLHIKSKRGHGYNFIVEVWGQ